MICVLTRSCRNLTSPATASRQLYCSFSHICLRSGSCEKEPPSIIHSRQIDLSSEYTASGSTKAPRKPSAMEQLSEMRSGSAKGLVGSLPAGTTHDLHDGYVEVCVPPTKSKARGEGGAGL